MTFLFYFVLLATVPLMLWPFLKEKHVSFMWIGTLLGANIIFGIGTYRSCASGWISPSIGSRGACSHHGGVISNLNEVGYFILVLCAFFLVIKLFLQHKADQIVKATEPADFLIESTKIQNNADLLIKEKNTNCSIEKAPKFDDYKKFVPIWHRNDLSVEDITLHLKSKGVAVNCNEVYKYLDSCK